MGWLPPSGVYVLEPGSSVRVGEALVEYRRDGVLIASDSYGGYRIYAGGLPVKVYPSQPLYRLRRLTDCLAIILDEDLVVPSSGRVSYWFKAPLELTVAIGGVVSARLSPRRVKHVLVGEIVDGVVCRSYHSSVYTEPPEPSEGEALVKVVFKPSVGFKLSMIVFYVDVCDIYVSSDGTPFLELVEAMYTGGQVAFKLTDQPPVDGVKRVEESHVAKSFQRRVFLYKP